MIEFSLANKRPNVAVRIGATRGQADIEPLVKQLAGFLTESAVVMNFSGIEAINSSYARASVGWLLRCGMLARGGMLEHPETDGVWAIRPINLAQIVLRNLAGEVREEIDGLLRQPSFKLACFEFRSPGALAILGHLDAALWDCLSKLYDFGGTATAPDLHKHNRREGVQITAWNNRLSALYVRMLVDRRKEGRFWVYRTVSKNIEPYGIQVPT